jgi:hypothetical protein
VSKTSNSTLSAFSRFGFSWLCGYGRFCGHPCSRNIGLRTLVGQLFVATYGDCFGIALFVPKVLGGVHVVKFHLGIGLVKHDVGNQDVRIIIDTDVALAEVSIETPRPVTTLLAVLS